MQYMRAMAFATHFDSSVSRSMTLQAGEEKEVLVGNRAVLTALAVDGLSKFCKRDISTLPLIGIGLTSIIPLENVMESKNERVKWLSKHFDTLLEGALIVSSVALAVLGYEATFGWTLAASLALGVFARCDFSPPVVGRVIQQVRKLSGVALLFRANLFFRIWGVIQTFSQLQNIYFDYFSVKRERVELSLDQYSLLEAAKLKLHPSHIYEKPSLSLPDLPDVDLKGFRDLAEKINWEHTENIEELVKALKSDEKWLNQGGSQFIVNGQLWYDRLTRRYTMIETRGQFNEATSHWIEKNLPSSFFLEKKEVKEHMIAYIKGAIPEAVSKIVERRVKASEPDYPQMIVKLKYILRDLPKLSPAGQATVLAQLGRDGNYCGPKVVDMVDSLYQYVCVLQQEGAQEEVPLEAALLLTLEGYRQEQMEKKINTFKISNLHVSNLVQRIFGRGYLYSNKAAKDQALDVFENVFLPLSLVDYFYAWKDKEYSTASKMYADYEKNIVSIVQEAIGKTQLLSEQKVIGWLEAWAERNGTEMNIFYDEEYNLKPSAIALMLVESGIVI